MQKNKKQKALCFLLLFSLSFAGIAFGTYFLFLRYGKSFIWNYDGIKQHYAALCYLGKYYREIVSGFLAGDFVLPMFDFSLGMGEDIITTLNFYGLGDPLTLLAALVPEQKTEYLYNFLVIFRIYLAGLSFAWFCREKGRSFNCTFIGALVYAFSGYVLHVAVKHPFFVIPMIFLPLVVVGVDRVLEKKKFTLLILVVFLTALNGFYEYTVSGDLCTGAGVLPECSGRILCGSAFGRAKEPVFDTQSFPGFVYQCRALSGCLRYRDGDGGGDFCPFYRSVSHQYPQ